MLRKWRYLCLMLCLFVPLSSFSVRAETTQITAEVGGEPSGLKPYKNSTQRYEKTIIIDHIVYVYRQETDDFSAECIDFTSFDFKAEPEVKLDLEIPSYILGKPVRGANSFSLVDSSELEGYITGYVGKVYVTSLVFPDTIDEKYLNFNSDHGGWSIRSLTIKGKIRELSLAEGDNLRKLVIYPGITTTGTFSECRKLTTVRLPEGLRKVENWAFYACSSLKKMALPEGVKKIGEEAFKGAKKLQLYVPESVKKIGKDAFGSSKTNKIKKLYCVRGSVAHKYAVKHKIPYTLVNKKPGKRKVTGLTAAKKNITLAVGTQEMLYVTVKPFYASGQKLTWKSSNQGVLSIDKFGKATAKAPGNVVVTVKAKGGAKVNMNVTVEGSECKPAQQMEAAQDKERGRK